MPSRTTKPYPAYQGDKPYVFVSYSHRDTGIVYSELSRLGEQGVNVWYDEGIEAGTEWRDEIAKAIKHASLLIFFVTPQSVDSKNCRKEVNFAIDQEIPLIAVHLEQTVLPDGLNLSLSDRQAILRTEMTDAEYEHKLATRLNDLKTPLRGRPPTTETKTHNHKALYLVITSLIVLGAGLAFFLSNGAAPESLNVEYGQASGQVKSSTLAINRLSSVAVMPFTTVSIDTETRALAASVFEDVVNRLSHDENLTVTSSSASSRIQDEGLTLFDAASKLNVAYVLEGSMQRQGENVRVLVRLLEAEGGSQIWAQSYEARLTNDFTWQDQLAGPIAFYTGSILLSDAGRKLRAKEESFKDIDPAALALFREADRQYDLMRLGMGGELSLIRENLSQAISIAPDFEEAHIFFGNSYMQLHGYGILPLQEALPLAHQYMSEALRLNQNSRQAYIQLAQLYVNMDWDYEQAEKLLEEHKDETNNSIRLYLLARIAIREGRIDEALSLVRGVPHIAQKSERAIFLGMEAYFLQSVDNWEQSLTPINEIITTQKFGEDKAVALVLKISALRELGDNTALNQVVEELWQLESGKYRTRHLASFIDSPRHIDAIAIFENSKQNIGILQKVIYHTRLEQLDLAFAALEQAILNHNNLIADTLRISSHWEPLRSDPRYAKMVALLESEETHTLQYLKSKGDLKKARSKK